MAAFVKFYAFIDEQSKGTHNLQADVFKIALTNTAPVAATDTAWSVGTYPAPPAGNGYTAGGNAPAVNSAATTAGVFKLNLADTVFTAAGGQMGPLRYAILYNSSKANKVVGYWDYGSSVTLNDAETLTVDLDQAAGALTIA